MSLEVRFTPEAEETFELLVEQVEQRWGKDFVSKLKIKTRKSLLIISSNPYLYPVVQSSVGLRKCVLHKNCSLLYKVFDRYILVVCFWDNRQNPLITV